MQKRQRYIGLMSGTSLDGVDAVICELGTGKPRILAAGCTSIRDDLRAALLALNAAGEDELNRAALAGNELARLYATAVREVLARASLAAADITAIGCHGQTIRHRPELGYSVQIGNSALLAELTGIRVVSDFRSRDIAAGGQGAPLVPAFHAEAFQTDREDRVILNLGGIANVTYLPRRGGGFGFDTGPGNCLLDHWASLHLNRPYDAQGGWARSGHVADELLRALLAEPYFSAARPKSTGRDLFNDRWLAERLSANKLSPVDVQATLLELTAQSVASATRSCGPFQALILCGGGVHNRALVARLKALAAPARVESSAQHGIDPDYVEATAFAWLAKRALLGESGNLPAVTGARGARVLGAVYPG